jgi:hypothetical protein
MAFGVFAFGEKTEVPGPEVWVHIPVPIVGAVALRVKLRPHTSPPVPATETGV